MTRKTVDPMAFTQPIERAPLSPANERVLKAIIWYQGRHQKSPLPQDLAVLLDCSPTAIRWHETKLKAAGAITVEQARRGRRTVTVLAGKP